MKVQQSPATVANECSRRDFVARIAEVTATVPLIGMALVNFGKSRSYYSTNTSEAVLPERPDKVSQFSALQVDYAKALSDLSQA